MNSCDEYWMKQALLLAEKAADSEEVPVGAVVIFNNEIIGRGFNQPISSCDPTAHAEIIALREAAGAINNYRLVNATLYVTLEPCTMCVGAIVHSRIQRLVFGAYEPKAGAVVSQSQLLDASYMNYQVAYEGGICADQCGSVLSHFFARRRQQKKQ